MNVVKKYFFFSYYCHLSAKSSQPLLPHPVVLGDSLAFIRDSPLIWIYQSWTRNHVSIFDKAALQSSKNARRKEINGTGMKGKRGLEEDEIYLHYIANHM